MICQAYVQYGVAINYNVDIPVLKKVLSQIDQEGAEYLTETYGEVSDRMSTNDFYQMFEEAVGFIKSSDGFTPDAEESLGVDEDDRGLVYVIGDHAGYACGSDSGTLTTSTFTDLEEKKSFDNFFSMILPPERIGLIVYTAAG